LHQSLGFLLGHQEKFSLSILNENGYKVIWISPRLVWHRELLSKIGISLLE
jgi:hypothetical protein